MNDLAEDPIPLELGTLDVAKDGLPLVVRPGRVHDAVTLAAWLKDHGDWTRSRLVGNGAILFRGFGIDSPRAFEEIALAIDPELKNDYLGTSPRDARSTYVFSASELPGYYPIPQHCEMTFIATPPRRLFFWCERAPSDPGGETPLVDFQKVWAGLDADVRGRFEQRGVQIIRNYGGPGTKSRDLFQLKRWDEMFRTTDKGEVGRRARDEGFEPSWHENDRLSLVSRHAAARANPDDGQPVWFNHAQVFHLSSAPSEFRRIFRRRPGIRPLALWWFSAALVAWKRMTVAAMDQALHCTYADGTEIPTADMEHVRDRIWEHLVAFAWETGDAVAINNHRIGHGRLPYTGPRSVAVAWA